MCNYFSSCKKSHAIANPWKISVDYSLVALNFNLLYYASMDYEQLKAKYGSPLGIALALGFCTEKSSKKRKDGAISRVCNWKRTKIPTRQLKRILELDK